MSIADNYRAIREEVDEVCIANGRDPKDVCLLAVSKTVGPQGVSDAIEGGAECFGENRPEQLREKALLFPQATWHFIGNIQSRKIKEIVEFANLVHSLESESHALKMDQAAKAIGKVQDVLIEVNVSGEESKSGVTPDGLSTLIKACQNMASLNVKGLMTMAPQGDAERARQTFAGLRSLRDSVRSTTGLELSELSMGMSEDWREAIAEGSTIVRIGRAIFDGNFGRSQL